MPLAILPKRTSGSFRSVSHLDSGLIPYIDGAIYMRGSATVLLTQHFVTTTEYQQTSSIKSKGLFSSLFGRFTVWPGHLVRTDGSAGVCVDEGLCGEPERRNSKWAQFSFHNHLSHQNCLLTACSMT